MLGFFRRMMLRERGRKAQTTAEYAIIVALVAIASITVIAVFGDQLRAPIAGETRMLAGEEDVTVDDRTGDLTQDALEGTLDNF